MASAAAQGGHGGAPAPAAVESEGEKVREEEEVARNLTVRSNRAKEGRERKLDGRGGAPAANNGGRPAQGRFGRGNGTNGLREGRWR